MNKPPDNSPSGAFEYRVTRDLIDEKKKRPTNKVDKIAVHFQPDAVEVELRSLPFTARFALYTILFLLIAAIAWAAWAKVDRAVSVRGKMVSQSRTVVQQPIKSSVIRSLDAKAGDFVSKGQLIATLDPTVAKADKGQLKSRLEVLEAELSRLNAEMQKQEFIPSNDSHALVMQGEIFKLRQQERAITLFGFDARYQTLVAQAEIAQAQEAQIIALQELATIKYDNANRLAQSNSGSRVKVKETTAEVARLKAAQAEKISEQTRYQHEQTAAKMEREQYITGQDRQLQDRRLTVVNEIQQLDFELQKAEKVGEFDVFVAMSDGVILDATKKSVGSIVDAGEVIFTLVPTDKGLDIEVELSPQDIGWVHIGQSVRVKLDPFPFQRHGTLEGELSSISPDSFQKTTAGQTQIYYKAKVTIVENQLHNLPDNFKLLPGITVTAEIKIGKRTVLSSITDPFHKALDESLKEPN